MQRNCLKLDLQKMNWNRLNRNLAKSRSPLTYIIVEGPPCNFALSTTTWMPCSVLIAEEFINLETTDDRDVARFPLESLLRWLSAWLTYWDRDKMATILHRTFSNVFSLMKIYEFRLRFHWSLFHLAILTKFQHWFNSSEPLIVS